MRQTLLATGVFLASWLAVPGTGNAASSTSANPTVTFNATGTKQVSLTTCNGSGCSTKTRDVQVLDPKPHILSLGLPPALIGQGQPVVLQATAEGRPGLTYRWLLTRGLTTTTLTGDPVTWNTASSPLGLYVVVLQVSNSSGIDISVGVTSEITRMTFGDVPPDGFGWAEIETLAAYGITLGCSTNPLLFCPNQLVTRDQMAVFLLRALEGGDYLPPACVSQRFNDVPCTRQYAAWINELARREITLGCGNNNYCPAEPLTRAQMAIFLIRVKETPSYLPPLCTTPLFGDVPCSNPFAGWINELARRGITNGCGNGNFCPGVAVTRAQMAIFLTRDFNLTLPPVAP
jgi:hypothetical protein